MPALAGHLPRTSPMAVFLARRLALAAVTLWLLSVIVFVGAQVLPGTRGGRSSARSQTTRRSSSSTRARLGRAASDALLGLVLRLPPGDIVLHLRRTGLRLHRPRARELAQARALRPRAGHPGEHPRRRDRRSEGRQAHRPGDHGHRALALAVVPEFVTGIVLILVFGIWLDLLPVTAAAPAASTSSRASSTCSSRRWR